MLKNTWKENEAQDQIKQWLNQFLANVNVKTKDLALELLNEIDIEILFSKQPDQFLMHLSRFYDVIQQSKPFDSLAYLDKIFALACKFLPQASISLVGLWIQHLVDNIFLISKPSIEAFYASLDEPQWQSEEVQKVLNRWIQEVFSTICLLEKEMKKMILRIK